MIDLPPTPFADQSDQLIGVDPEPAGLGDQRLHLAFGEPPSPSLSTKVIKRTEKVWKALTCPELRFGLAWCAAAPVCGHVSRPCGGPRAGVS